jgi:rhamnosyltransferase
LRENVKVEVSIIILTKNGEDYLEEGLKAIFKQRTSRSFEVIAIDSGSRDNTLSILKRYPVRLFQIPPEEFNHGETRNLGASLSCDEAEYLIYLTQDAIPTPGWLDNLIHPLEEDKMVAGAFSRHVPRPDCNPLVARRITTDWEQCGGLKRIVKRIDDISDYHRRKLYYAHFSNTSSCIRKSVWMKYPFARVEFAEDVEWANRVLKAGYAIVYEPNSAVIHSHSGSLWRQFRENFDHARGIRSVLGLKGGEPLLPLDLSRREKLRRDVIYILKNPFPWPTKLKWLLYGLPWHLASVAGQWVGANFEHLPLPKGMACLLSWQEAIKRA